MCPRCAVRPAPPPTERPDSDRRQLWFLSKFSVNNPLIIKLDDKEPATKAAFAKVHAAATLIAREEAARKA